VIRALQHTVQDYSANGYDDGFQHDPDYSYDPSASFGAGGSGVKEEKPEFGGEGQESAYDDDYMFKQDDYWTVISTFFEDKGLVRQQLESFNEFVETTIQEVVEDNKRLVLDQYQQYNTMERDQAVCCHLTGSNIELMQEETICDRVWSNLPVAPDPGRTGRLGRQLVSPGSACAEFDVFDAALRGHYVSAAYGGRRG
jgi:hypothetical protein